MSLPVFDQAEIDRLRRLGARADRDDSPKLISLDDRRRELKQEKAKAVRDNPPEAYKPALEAWGFRWELRDAGWTGPSGAVMGPDEAAKIGAPLLRENGWSPGQPQMMWVQREMRMAFRPEDLSSLFPGERGPYDFWHWVGHEVGKRLGHPRCKECGKALGLPEKCGACGTELRAGRCARCSMVQVVSKPAGAE